jgi:hypothetical protein
MKVRVTRTFRVALDGGTDPAKVVTVFEGSVVEDEFVCGVALRGEHGELVQEAALEAAPRNAALPGAPSVASEAPEAAEPGRDRPPSRRQRRA